MPLRTRAIIATLSTIAFVAVVASFSIGYSYFDMHVRVIFARDQIETIDKLRKSARKVPAPEREELLQAIREYYP